MYIKKNLEESDKNEFKKKIQESFGVAIAKNFKKLCINI